MEIHQFGNGVTCDFGKCNHFPVAHGVVGRRVDSENCLEHVKRRKPNVDPENNGLEQVQAVPMTSKNLHHFQHHSELKQ